MLATHLDAQERFCPYCDYSLSGLTSQRCPECGRAVDAALADRAVLAWPRRTALTWPLAYVLTCLQVILTPWSLGRELARPVNPDDSRRFFRLSVATLIATVTPFAVLRAPGEVWLPLAAPVQLSPQILALLAVPPLLASLAVGPALALAALSGRATRRRRAVWLAGYLSAALLTLALAPWALQLAARWVPHWPDPLPRPWLPVGRSGASVLIALAVGLGPWLVGVFWLGQRLAGMGQGLLALLILLFYSLVVTIFWLMLWPISLILLAGSLR